jgi:arylsulfatase A-like enzyme
MKGEKPDGWQTSMYYRYWMHLTHHHVYSHYGVRTERFKLIYYYGEALGASGAIDDPKAPEWEMFDLAQDPYELNNVYHDPKYADMVTSLKKELYRLKEQVRDEQ